jgi:D-serine deaminase-like pyridoxal phosphate-dependent protein
VTVRERPRSSGSPGSDANAQVAQLVEHVTENHGVGGSIPPLGTILDLSTPTLVLDRSRLERNAARMRDKVRDLGVTLRPHVKTSKSIDVLRVLAGWEAVPITVSTLAEARYFFSHGVTDILYAVGIAPVKLPEVADLIHAGWRQLMPFAHSSMRKA